MRLIDSKKLLEWLENSTEGDGFWAGSMEEATKSFDALTDAINSGTFSPTPPVQPDKPKPGDKVRHMDKQYAPNGIGIVKEISKSGKQAYVEWTNWDKDHFKWGGPWPAYYRLDKLEVITDDPST